MKEKLIKAIEEHKYSYYQDTAMVLELICEKLFYEHNIDARWHGRSIYINGERVASIQTMKDGKNLIAIDTYKII